MAKFLHNPKRNKKRSHARQEKFHPMIKRGISPYILYTLVAKKGESKSWTSQQVLAFDSVVG